MANFTVPGSGTSPFTPLLTVPYIIMGNRTTKIKLCDSFILWKNHFPKQRTFLVSSNGTEEKFLIESIHFAAKRELFYVYVRHCPQLGMRAVHVHLLKPLCARH